LRVPFFEEAAPDYICPKTKKSLFPQAPVKICPTALLFIGIEFVLTTFLSISVK